MTSSHLTNSCSAARKVRAIISSGRGIHRLVTLCGTITQLVNENDRRLPGSGFNNDEDGDEEGESPEKEEVRR